ncbi:DUF2948 family protein [Corticibacterium sp. UT-5YL-CI-8]|nr:DUF2948 family protein [Tianweitania sp. UT-5YL-CI-8]
MEILKLAALDEQDLEIISAHVQDAVTKVGELKFVASSRQFALPLNRFAWEQKSGVFSPRNERRQSLLSFGRVLSVKTSGIDRDKKEEVLSLLAVQFVPVASPAGAIDLIFAGDATIRLEVECIEARLSDTGAAWQASSRPIHKA